MAEFIGDGRIDGWEIDTTTLAFPNVRVSKGTGFIDKQYVTTFNDVDIELEASTVVNFYAQRRVGIIASIGPRSDVASIIYNDSGAPAAVSGFSATASLINPASTVILTWTANAEIDFDHYSITRRTTSPVSDFINLDNNVTAVTFTDSAAVEDTAYEYRIIAVDQSGFSSSESSDTITTSLSSILPSDPSEVTIKRSEGAINVLWKRPPAFEFSKINNWEIEWIKLDSDGSTIGSLQTDSIDRSLFSHRIDNLLNGENYRITLRTVDTKGRKSLGITDVNSAQISRAPKDPENLSITAQVKGPGGVILNLAWTDGADEYDPLIPYTYKIYITVDGQQESSFIPVVPIGSNSEQIEIYKFSENEFFFIPENTLITLRITSVSQNGLESFGNYLKFITSKFEQVLPARNLVAKFDRDNAQVLVTWNNPPNTSSASIQIIDDDLDDQYDAAEIINKSVGLTDRFSFDGLLNHVYSVFVILTDSLGATSSSVTVSLSTNQIPGFPSLPVDMFPQSGDREVSFTWRPARSTLSLISYKIYKKKGNITTTPSDWSLIDTVPDTITKFSDFGLTNDQIYSYYVTSVDVFGRESLHLPNDRVNLNFVEIIPKSSGMLTEPDGIELSLVGNSISISWDALIENFDAFTIYRSVGNLHLWENIATVDKDVLLYLDEGIPLIDGTVFYYTIVKTISDADITIVPNPENAIFIGELTVGSSSFGALSVDSRRDLLDMIDPIGELTDQFLLTHQHKEIERLDPTRIDLEPELIITDWETFDGKVFTTNETDISGTGHIVKVDGRFPKVLFSIDVAGSSIIFAEPIVSVDESGNITGDLPSIEMKVTGLEEVQGSLESFRFNKIHARQVGFGRITKEQTPSLNHEGRIRETMLPKSYLLERFSEHAFIVPQTNTDDTKTFGDGTTFYAVIESDGLIKEVVDFDQEDDGDLVAFQKPSFSSDTVINLEQHTSTLEVAAATDNSNELRFITEEMHGISINATPGNVLFSVNRNTLSKVSISVAAQDTGIVPWGMTLDSNANIAYVNSAGLLYQLDLRTGESSTSGDGVIDLPSGNTDVYATEFNENNNILYAITDNILGTINTTTNVFTAIGVIDVSVSRFFGMAYDKDSDIMYVVDNISGGSLWTVNLTTGAGTKVHSSNKVGTRPLTLTFDYDDGNLYVASGSTLKLYRVDPATGLGVDLGSFVPPDSGSKMACITARPKDNSFWITGTDNLHLGQLAGKFSDVYLRFPVNIDLGATVSLAEIQFTAHSTFDSTGTVSLRVSMLDPSLYVNSITLSTESIKSVATIGTSVNWSPPDWSASENGADTSATVTDLIQTFVDDDGYFEGRNVIFKIETLPNSTVDKSRYAQAFDTGNGPALKTSFVHDLAEVTSEVAFQSEKSYHFQFSFDDTDPTRWVRVSTFNSAIKPNPIIDLKKRLRFRILLESGSLYVALGVREITDQSAATGDNGGIVGPIEWVGTSSVVNDGTTNQTPIGKLVTGKAGEWQEIEFDIENDATEAFSADSDGILTADFGVLEHLAFTVVPSDSVSVFDVYIDKIEQVDDVLAAGTSQGILLSRDFGSSWTNARLVETPVHKFYRAQNNPFIWAISGNQVLIAIDPANWFETSGLTGSQFIRDIAEDEFGNMFVSTEKGVFWFEIALINNFSSWRQTQPVNAFTTDCFGMYHNIVASGIDEIWVSTEVGIFKTLDKGQTWTDTEMKTEGLVSYEFANISSNPVIDNVIGITRKHVVRKMGNETDFSAIANFEVQHDIFDIWKMKFFADKIYISTGKGMYVNSLDELDVAGVTTPFEKVFPDLNFNGRTGVAFGLDVIVTEDGVSQLFIGQENRLMMAKEDNTLSIKEQFPNKELPSFFSNNTELNIGYIYNAFNNVLIFREAQPVNTTYRASNLPRKAYIPVNGGWAHANPDTDSFIYFNGFPKWLDFQLDESSILSEVQSVETKLKNAQGTLTDFNSLSPDAANLLSTVLSNIIQLKEGNEGKPLVSDTAIITFLDNYTRFLSLISSSVIITNELNVFPRINTTGLARDFRTTGSRAGLLEAKEEFVANESTGINIDTFTGEVDFLSVFNATTDIDDKLEFTFNKYDNMQITVFNANIKNTGEFTHRELESFMEGFNTGLSSHLSRAHYTNLIKAGIFFEMNHNSLFNTYNVNNVQSKFYGAHTNNWYDIVNSTVDYDLILKVDGNPEIKLANSITHFTEHPYLIDRVWIGTDSDIVQYIFSSSTGDLEIEAIVRPGNGTSALFIWDVFVRTEEDIYVVAEDKTTKVGKIFNSVDAGGTWTELDTVNLPQKLYGFKILSGNKVAFTENGVFYSDNDFGTWFPSTLNLSPQLSDNSPTIDAFSSRIRNSEKATFLIAESDRWLFTSGSGIDWFALSGQLTTNSTSVINKVIRWKSLTWAATDQGLYNDANSILSDGVQFGLQKIESTASLSAGIHVTDVVSGDTDLYCSSSVGKIYRLRNNEWKSYQFPDLDTIHKILVIETDLDFDGVRLDYMIVVSHNVVKIIDISISLFT